MIDTAHLRDDLVRQVTALEADLREQVQGVPEVGRRLRAEYDTAFRLGRTAATWTQWLDGRVTQTAVAWVLGTVFVRFCEDTHLLVRPRITGPDDDRRQLAEEAQEDFFLAHPEETDRGWLLAAFDEIARSQAGALLFDQKHNPLYHIPVSHDAAKALIGFWRRRGEDGALVHSFADQGTDTRFLGDLYQDLSASARKTYALLQTPEFVEEFILDYTLTPATREFGHDEVRMVDPACGSGHFVLGAFHRLLTEWENEAPARDQRERVRLALGQVHGVEINPFAAAIARFRLLIAALKASGIGTLEEAEKYEFPLNIAIGDALIKHRQETIPGVDEDEALADFQYVTEDILDRYPRILDEGKYHVVVGNPPYVTVKDKKLNALYRGLYSACSGKYALSVPFAQRFFELARTPGGDGKRSGYVGQITANSFMKREFGKRLIEEFFANQVDLTHVIDTSGAYIPGHGTPTVIVIGRNKNYRYSRSETVRTVLGIRGEPSTPDQPRRGYVWRALVDQIEKPGSESDWISVSDIERSKFTEFPWSLAGGGSSGLLELITSNSIRMLAQISQRLGVFGMTNSDEVMLAPNDSWSRRTGSLERVRQLVAGEDIRDWCIEEGSYAFFPYDQDYSLLPLKFDFEYHKWMWPTRTTIGNRATFSKETYFQEGRPWYEWHQITVDRDAHEWTLTYSFVATHNHFVLDRGGKVFKQTAPVIKLPEGTTEHDHLKLLGVLNSSTACFWIKQACFDRGNGGIGGGIASEDWEKFYEVTGTKLQDFPLPSTLPLQRARRLDSLAQELAAATPASIAEKGTPTRDVIEQARSNWHSTRAQMIAEQEELDWEVYSLYGILDEDLTAPTEAVPELNLGERAFEIVLARRMEAGEVKTEWFNRHGSTPITELPSHWSPEYRAVVERRIELIESNRNIGLIERPEGKRRWATEGFDAMRDKALRDWLLDRLETRELWFAEIDGIEQPQLRTTTQLADALRDDPDTVSVAELYAPGRELEKLVAELVATEHVPYLAALRYKDSGLRKRAEWEHVWDRQRAEDTAATQAEKKEIRDAIPVPPKYATGDFRQPSYWRNRGKLDVPKERFISYPYAGRDGATSTKDGALLLGWAGFDHCQQAQALALLLTHREQDDGWGAEQLTPLLAGLREVLPWVTQWHTDFDPVYYGSPAEFFTGFLSQTTERLGLTPDALAAWRPPSTGRGRKKSDGGSNRRSEAGYVAETLI